MLRLRALGWGERRIAAALGCSRRAVRRYLAEAGRPRRAKRLDGLEDWLSERFRRHRGNATLCARLKREQGVTVSLRTVERAVTGLRQSLATEARATFRFETPPGRQLQIDFGEAPAAVGGEDVKLHLFLATLGYSRRVFVRVFRHERQSAWFDGMEATSAISAGLRRRFCSTTPRRWLIITTPSSARFSSTSGCTRSRVTGSSSGGPAPAAGRGPGARLKTASAT